MTDKELTELAALACNIPIVEELWCPVFGFPVSDKREWWNPLENDGDCFRLSAHCRIAIKQGKYKGDGATAYCVHGSVPDHTVFSERGMAEHYKRPEKHYH